MYSTASLNIHHKSEEGNAKRFFLVRWYYNYYPFFGYCCVAAEFTYILLFMKFHNGSSGTTKGFGIDLEQIIVAFLKFCIPGCATKQIVNIFQLLAACHVVADHDAATKNK